MSSSTFESSLPSSPSFAPFTYPPEITPEQIWTLENEPQVFQWKCKKPDAQWLHDKGDWRSACRYDGCSTIFRLHDAKTGRVRENISACREVCFCENCAHYRFQDVFNRYRVLVRVLPESFTYVIAKPECARDIKNLLKPLGPLLGLFCWRPAEKYIPGRFETRMILCATSNSIPYATLEQLRVIDPDIRIRSYSSSRFLNVLNRMLVPTLPPELDNKLILKRTKRRLTFEGMTQAMRRKLFVKKNPTQSNNISGSGKKKPACHVPGCTRHTKPYLIGTPESEWVWIEHTKTPEKGKTG